MGQNNNEGKINLVQLVLGLGSLIGSVGYLVHGSFFCSWSCSHFILDYRVYSYRNDFL